MIIYPLYFAACIIVVFAHTFLNLYLCSTLSDGVRFHKLSIPLACLINGILSPFLLGTDHQNPMSLSLIYMLVLIFEVSFLFKGKFSKKMGVALGSLLHLFVIRATVIATLSIVLDISMRSVMQQAQLYPWVNLGSFALQLITLTLFITLIPLKTMRRIMDNHEVYKSLFLLVALLCTYMIYNTYTFDLWFISVNLAVQEIVIAWLVLAFFYIMVLLLIKIFHLGTYKEKTKALEVQIDKDRILTSAVFNYSAVIIEINCTQDEIVRILINSVETPISHTITATEFMKKQMQEYIHPDDIFMLHNLNSPALVSDFEKGISEKVYEYRFRRNEAFAKTGETTDGLDDYLWYRLRINTSSNKHTKDVFAILTMDEIHSEKQEELALRYKAERDPLTGAYNKDAFCTKVNEYLHEHTHGTLYMFDLDNFKGINDNMGHSMGDTVLREVYAKTSALFRNLDLIGRIGGDEFVVFLSGPAELATLEGKALKICQEINKTYHAQNGIDIEISCSVGVSTAPADGTDFEQLFNMADLAMYYSKNKGKNAFTFYDADLANGFKPQDSERYKRIYSAGENQ